MELQWVLHHHPFCPHSRAARLVLAEVGCELKLSPQKPWERHDDFLALNPTGSIPVLELNKSPIVGVGAITEFIEDYEFEKDTIGLLIPKGWQNRAEYRRIRDWFDIKFAAEVSDPIVHEQVYRRQMPPEAGGGAPETDILRQAMQNLKSHLAYLDYLLERSGWLIGEHMSLVDLIVAAHLSCLDYFGLINWADNEAIKDWYARIKSRPSFQNLLAARIPGITPPNHYNLYDF